MHRRLPGIVVGVALGMAGMSAQAPRVIPRPPAPATPGAPAGESATPDGYQPIPQWLGQTHAALPARTAAYAVETVAEGCQRCMVPVSP